MSHSYIPRDPPIVQPIFTFKTHHQSPLQVLTSQCHDSTIAVLQDARATNFELALSGLESHLRLTPEIDNLSSVVSFVLRCIIVHVAREPRIIPGGGTCVVINKVDAPGGG